MTCQTVLDRLTEYVDGELPFGRRIVIDVHLRLCRHCRDYLDSLRIAVEASRRVGRDSAFEREIPDEMVQAILKALAERSSH